MGASTRLLTHSDNTFQVQPLLPMLGAMWV
jgi:hypothetical protein